VIKTSRPCPQYRPDFFHEVDDVAGTIRYFSTANGFEAIFDTKTHNLRSHTRQTTRIPIQPALDLESRYVRRSSPPSVLMSGDKHDTTSYAGTTGGGRRHFISVAFERAVLGKQDGFDALYAWGVDQGQRPTAWYPFAFKYDGYFGSLIGSNWNYDSKQGGWSIFRADHLESCILFGGAALGEDICLAMFCELMKWVHKTFWNAAAGKLQQGWHGSRQMRAMGWVLLFAGHGSFLGLDFMEDAFLQEFVGIKPKDLLRTLLDDLARRPPRIGEQTKPDDRTMVDLHNGTNEVIGEYPWHWAILFYAVGWIERSGLMTSKKWKDFVTYLRFVAEDVWDRSIGPGGTTYAYSSTITFVQADVDLANKMELDKTHTYEHVDPDGNGFGPMRDVPRKADSELTASAIAMLVDPNDPRCMALLGKLAHYSNMANYDDTARYLDPTYALLEAAGLSGP